MFNYVSESLLCYQVTELEVKVKWSLFIPGVLRCSGRFIYLQFHNQESLLLPQGCPQKASSQQVLSS